MPPVTRALITESEEGGKGRTIFGRPFRCKPLANMAWKVPKWWKSVMCTLSMHMKIGMLKDGGRIEGEGGDKAGLTACE